jgi:hypothetical protein
MKVLKDLNKLSGKEQDFFDSHVVSIFNEHWSELLVTYEAWLIEEKNRPPPEEPKEEEKPKEEAPKTDTSLVPTEEKKSDEEVKMDAKKFLQDAFASFVIEEEEKKVAEEKKRKAREDRMNGVEPTITEENGQVVKIEEPELVVEEEPEIHEVDSLLAIKNWAMQSPDWKLLNVLIELMGVE